MPEIRLKFYFFSWTVEKGFFFNPRRPVGLRGTQDGGEGIFGDVTTPLGFFLYLHQFGNVLFVAVSTVKFYKTKLAHLHQSINIRLGWNENVSQQNTAHTDVYKFCSLLIGHWPLLLKKMCKFTVLISVTDTMALLFPMSIFYRYLESPLLFRQLPYL